MKIPRFLPLLIAVVTLASPLTGFGKDKHKHKDHHRGSDRDRGHSRHYDRDDRHRHSSHRSHYSRSYAHRSHGYGYGRSRYSDYGYGRSYYPRSSFGISFSSRPTYSSYSSYEPSYYEPTYYQPTYSGRVASGYSNSLAAQVQSELRRQGYYRGSIDGDIGPGSRAAIAAYQRDRGLRATGRIDSSLLNSLDIG